MRCARSFRTTMLPPTRRKRANGPWITASFAAGISDEFNGMWEDMMTREQLVTVLYRFAQKFGLS